MRRRAPQPRPRSTRSPIFGLALALIPLCPEGHVFYKGRGPDLRRRLRQVNWAPARFACGNTMSLGARVFLLLVPLLTALDPAAAHAAGSGDFAGLVDVGGGRKMYLECRGSGSPMVVFVAGLKGSAED